VAYVTHDQSEALAVSDQIVVMEAGRIAQAGSPRELYEQPASEFVAGFMGEAMLHAAQVEAGGAVQLGPLRWQPDRALQPGPVTLAIRPEAWRVEAAAATAPTLAGRLVKRAYLGSFLELTFETELGEIFVVCADVDRTWQVGDMLGLALADHGVSVVGR
jgi:iron(III) transport system ATP-binding protein